MHVSYGKYEEEKELPIVSYGRRHFVTYFSLGINIRVHIFNTDVHLLINQLTA